MGGGGRLAGPESVWSTMFFFFLYSASYFLL
jgi:hypothetical protein